MRKDLDVVLAKPAVEVVRVVRFPLERVWNAWTDPQKFAKWWPGPDLESTGITADVRIGGEFSWGLRRPENGNTYLAHGRYEDIVEHERFVLSWDSIRNGEEYVSGARVSLSFRTVSEGTEIRILHEFLGEAEMCRHYSEGWASAVEKLAVYLDLNGNVQENLGEPSRAILLQVEVPLSAAELWPWLTEADRITQWFPQQAELDANSGGSYSFRWIRANGSTHVRSGAITAVEAPMLLDMEWFPTDWDPAQGSEQDWREAARTMVHWRIRETGQGSCVVSLEHRGFQYGEGLDSMFKGHSEGWQEYVTNLREVTSGRADIR
ncbi:SRPBCC domain-containing protein [bacterium]|nr:SRPBCC domain-containing protein [bacterium]